MTLIIGGLLLWYGAHLFKRVAPAARARLGSAGQGLVALTLVAAITLMVFGYRHADPVLVWSLPLFFLTINNLLMLVALYLFVASGLKSGLSRHLRHPQLSAVIVWSLAHLLVNGDVPSIVLFGGLLAWAVLEIIVINRAVPDWTPGPAVTMPRELLTGGVTLLAFGLVGALHAWLSTWPFLVGR